MKKLVLVAGFMVAGLLAATPADALVVDTLDVTVGATPSAVAGSNLNGTINLGATPVTGTTYGVYTSQFLPLLYQTEPAGTLYGGSYLDVFTGGSATVALAPSQNEFGFTWGTIDAFNTVTLTDSAHNSYSFTGAQIAELANLAGLTSVAANGKTQVDVVFTDPLAQIVSATFSSSFNSFEIANLAEVPLPPALALFATGLIALAGFAAYRRARTDAV